MGDIFRDGFPAQRHLRSVRSLQQGLARRACFPGLGLLQNVRYATQAGYTSFIEGPLGINLLEGDPKQKWNLPYG